MYVDRWFSQIRSQVTYTHCNLDLPIILAADASQWRIQDGAFGANAPPPLTSWKSQPYLRLKYLTLSGQDQFSYTTHENMHILLAFITISPETEAN